ncbi:HNH endonuclease [Flavobacterium sp.]|jgi:hypothetical protein|uniref:HNH endonuclease n=1 Tax=Flavobacterium sp. TaxID=239 RepID=UPI0037852CE5
MTREERCELAIERGYIYNSETGKIFGIVGKEIKCKHLGYIRIQLKKNKKVYFLLAHQFAWYYINKKCVEEIDHINGIRDDNKISNLRSVSRNKNQWNQKKAKGYSYHKLKQKWQSQIRVNKKDIHLGTYNTEQEARNAYLQAKEKYHII